MLTTYYNLQAVIVTRNTLKNGKKEKGNGNKNNKN
jgi:hypothetical protein